MPSYVCEFEVFLGLLRDTLNSHLNVELFIRFLEADVEVPEVVPVEAGEVDPSLWLVAASSLLMLVHHSAVPLQRNHFAIVMADHVSQVSSVQDKSFGRKKRRLRHCSCLISPCCTRSLVAFLSQASAKDVKTSQEPTTS